MNALIGCEFSGEVRDAFIKRGHNAVSCDILPSEKPGPHIQDDLLTVLRSRAAKKLDIFIAHPPCTRLTNSGVRWLSVPPPGRTLEEMWAELEDAVRFYRALRDANIPRRAIENPIMHCHARERIRPGFRQVVQPWWFGEKAFKATGFELIGLPPLVPTRKLVPPAKGTAEHKKWSAVHRASPGPDRWKERSITYPGVARAMAIQWGGL